MAEAREQARQKALAGIKAAGEAGDWRALKAFLRMSFPADYRRDASVNVNAIATAQQVGIVIGEEERARLIALRDRITLAEGGANTQPEPEAKLQANLGAPIGSLAGDDAASHG